VIPVIATAVWTSAPPSAPLPNLHLMGINMRTSLAPGDMHTEACERMHSQASLALIGAVSGPHMLPIEFVQQASFSGALHSATMHSGKDDQTIADEIHISQSYMSRLMSGMFQKWVEVFIRFSNATNSRVPLQWLADRLGCDIVVRQRVVSEADALRAEVLRLRRIVGASA
jgi:hypothetical protein